MHIYKRITSLSAGVLLLVLTGCGTDSNDPAYNTPQTTAVIKISTNTPVPLAGISVRLPIPYGTTILMDAGNQVHSSVILPSGVLSGIMDGQARGTVISAFTSYSAPTQLRNGALKFAFVGYSTSFKSGEFATITCSFGGAAPVKNDFDMLLHATDTGGNTISVGKTFDVIIQ